MLPDTDSLALFVRAAEPRGRTQAAEASHIGLAAASRRMALLEQRFKSALALGTAKGLVVRPLAEDRAARRMRNRVKQHRPVNSSLALLLNHLTQATRVGG